MVITVLSIVTLLFSPKSIEVVEITSNVVNIRVLNSTDSKVICQAKKGETFLYKRTIGNWYMIEMYSEEYRYIHNSTAEITKKPNKFPLTGNQKRKFINELTKLEDRAAHDSGNWNYGLKFIGQERELIDCYKLNLFREKKIAAHLYRAIFENATEPMRAQDYPQSKDPYWNSFPHAKPGQVWLISENNISIMTTHEGIENELDYYSRLVVVIGKGTRIVIIESSGWLIVWKKVDAFNEKEEHLGTGWILVETVKNVTNISHLYQ